MKGGSEEFFERLDGTWFSAMPRMFIRRLFGDLH